MSPMPRMRCATRSGWNGSSASGFSPTPTNFSGCPVTARIDSAAPPRASPSILVRIDAGDAQALVELVGRLHRVLPGHGVGDEQNLGGIELFLELGELRHQLVVDVQAAGGVDQQNVAAGLHGFLARRRGPARPAWFPRACLRKSEASNREPERSTACAPRDGTRRPKP